MAKNWKGPRPVAIKLQEAVMFDLFPDSPAVIADFFITDQVHYEALYYPIRAGEITVEDLDRVLGDPEAITKLVNAAPSNPHHGIVFGYSAGLGSLDASKKSDYLVRWGPTSSPASWRSPSGPTRINMSLYETLRLSEFLRVKKESRKINWFIIEEIPSESETVSYERFIETAPYPVKGAVIPDL